MNQFIERFLLPLFVFISFLYAFHTCGQQNIELYKVFHHKSDNGVHLEVANISFYFSSEPQVKMLSDAHDQKGIQKIIFFPHVAVKGQECRNMIHRINQEQNAYGIKIQEVSKPVPGIQVFISFDPEKYSFSYESFESIGLQRGIVLRLYNKELIKKIENDRSKPILKTLWHTKKPCIAIDSGHGGIDGGTIVGGVREKDICLAIGQDLARLLRDNGIDVFLTRDSDIDILLDQRTTCANNFNADLFVSIHANYAVNQAARGIETFCSSSHLFKEQFSSLTVSDKVLVRTIESQRAREAKKLADFIQRNTCKVVEEYSKKVVDRKVKYSVAQVLLGAQMPTVLIEVGFLSNNEEAALLVTQNYQKVIARGIFDGIISFLYS